MRTKEGMPDVFLHVANGHSVTETIRAAGIPGALSIWADPLHEGPVPDVSDEELINVRARHLAGQSDPPSVREVADELRAWRAVVDDDAAYGELVLWYEHDLFVQLNLIQILDRIGRRRLSKPVSLVCVDSFPGHPRFKGLGELQPGELATLLPTRAAVNDAEYELSARAWQAFRAADPLVLDTFVRGDTSALPFLAPALRRHLEEFPWTRDGLSRTERRILSLLQHGPTDVWQVFGSLHDGETAFYVADNSFWTIVEGLAAEPNPLISLETRDGLSGTLPKGTMALTDTGRFILGGHADRITERGFDRWLGGVHLTAPARLARWDHAQERIVV
jgi:hypothetical protein